MHRRTLLVGLGVGTLSIAGCLSGADEPGASGTTPGDTATEHSETATDASPGTDDGNARTDLPSECPTSQDLDVEWPTELDESTVEPFVEEYEDAYYREVVVEYEPESQLDEYDLAGSVSGSPRAAGDGWILQYAGGGGVYRPTLLGGATPAEAPDGVEPIPIAEVDDERVVDTLEAAAETGEAEFHVDTPGEEVDRYVDLFSSLSSDFYLSGPGDSDTLYFDVDGTTVELSVTATNFHGDYAWEAWYYVDEQVVRRADDDETDPREGTLLECRSVE
ncbi:hypothetical protein [Halobellus marinus]|uniref:hypothetical protein n=1 Tax=Halobellus TaxID=1073986 RepID=UPI0028ADE293|nr:hypothetical protein [Halobellus sp. DFY28]